MLPGIFGLDILGLSTSLMVSVFHAAADAPPISIWPQTLLASATGAKIEQPVFRPLERAVSNWRHEALWNAVMSPRAAFQLALNRNPDGVARCVKLNNYWCIKKAGWTGEIASDAEGHVAFASALEGATVAALLLKRYYVDYSRHSALAIISRWAPAQCGLYVAAHATGLNVANRSSDVSLHDVAPRGIQNTLRARWLAGHRRGGSSKPGKAVALRRSVVADPLLKMMPAPEIAVGMGERDIKLKPFTLNLLGLGKSPLPPLTSCAADGPRIDAYASQAAAGVAPNANEDLHLFTEEGAPTANLARVMRNMAAVEIGPLSARGWLIEAGIAASVHRGAAEKPQPGTSPSPKP